MNMSKTWCPDCKREVLNVVGFIADGWEFTCGKCNQRFVVRFERVLTKRVPDRLADGGRKHPARAIKQIKKLLAKHGGR